MTPADFLRRDVPALGKSVFRLGLSGTFGLDEAGCSFPRRSLPRRPPPVVDEYLIAGGRPPELRQGTCVAKASGESQQETLATPGMRVPEQRAAAPPPVPSRCGAIVAMMQPANLGQFNHPAEFGTFLWPGVWSIARQ